MDEKEFIGADGKQNVDYRENVSDADEGSPASAAEEAAIIRKLDYRCATTFQSH